MWFRANTPVSIDTYTNADGTIQILDARRYLLARCANEIFKIQKVTTTGFFTRCIDEITSAVSEIVDHIDVWQEPLFLQADGERLIRRSLSEVSDGPIGSLWEMARQYVERIENISRGNERKPEFSFKPGADANGVGYIEYAAEEAFAVAAFADVTELSEILIAALKTLIACRDVEDLALREGGPAPSPQPYGVSDFGAEVLVRDWMVYLGLVSAEVTQAGSDGGIDVVSNSHVAQVKNYRDTVGVQPVRELFGVASAEGKSALFFTSGTFTTEAISFADRVEMPLFKYVASTGELIPQNEVGIVFLESHKSVSDQDLAEHYDTVIHTFLHALSGAYLCMNQMIRLYKTLGAPADEVDRVKESLSELDYLPKKYFEYMGFDGDPYPSIETKKEVRRECEKDLERLWPVFEAFGEISPVEQ